MPKTIISDTSCLIILSNIGELQLLQKVYGNSTLILDDNKARKIANQLGLHVTGTIGIIVRAKLNGIIPSIQPILEKIRQTNFRLSVEIETLALKAAQE